jgi:hypothetical protein
MRSGTPRDPHGEAAQDRTGDQWRGGRRDGVTAGDRDTGNFRPPPRSTQPMQRLTYCHRGLSQLQTAESLFPSVWIAPVLA